MHFDIYVTLPHDQQVPAEASALTDGQGAVQDGNQIKKVCLSSGEKSSKEKRGRRWGAQGRIGKGSAGRKKGLFKTVSMSPC